MRPIYSKVISEGTRSERDYMQEFCKAHRTSRMNLDMNYLSNNFKDPHTQTAFEHWKRYYAS